MVNFNKNLDVEVGWEGEKDAIKNCCSFTYIKPVPVLSSDHRFIPELHHQAIPKWLYLFLKNSFEMRVIHVSVPLYSDKLRELKVKSGKKKTKEALAVAILHYLSCGWES